MRITGAVLQALQPILNEIRVDLTSLKRDSASLKECLNETMKSLSGALEEHTNQGTSELADLQTSLQTHINNTSTGLISDTVLLKLLPHMKNIKENLTTDFSSVISDKATSINKSVNSLRGDLVEYKSQTTSELADLHASLQSTINTTHNEQQIQLDSQLVSLNSHMSHEINSLESQVDGMINPLISKLGSVTATSTLMKEDLSCVKADLTRLNDSMNRVCDKVEEHEDQMTAELMELNEYLKENLTHQINSLGVHTCGGTGGWRRAVYLDMTDPNTDCPSGWRETGYSKRTCGKTNSGRYTCDSVTFPVSGGTYSQVCGRIKAYQWGSPSGFLGYRHGHNTIDKPYFSGVSVMHGSPRQHIWTFVAGDRENYTYPTTCPCDSTSSIRIPTFVGEDYFCEAAYIYPGYYDPESEHIFHSNDTLWDGKDCHSSSTCCSRRNPPYFTKTLNTPTTDDLELRMCTRYNHYSRYGEDVAVELIELYVKENRIETQLLELDQHLKKSFTHQINNINSLGVHTCGGTGGWRRAVYLDMTDPSTDCPSGWIGKDHPKRTCTGVNYSCDSVTFPVSGGEYSQVCGRIKAYQWGQGQGFSGYRLFGRNTTDDAYFSGVNIMHGSPRQHIWTFVVGIMENYTSSSSLCPCDVRYYQALPPFVGEDYFCESGYISPGYWDRVSQLTFHSNDTLWDGKDCHSTSTCCSRQNPPYFTKTLSLPTTDDIELRACGFGYDSSVEVELIELYVKQ